jgi:hypothetical protein
MSEFNELMADLNAGVFEQQIARALSDTALGVVTTGKKGKVTITFDLRQIGESSQVECTHSLSYSKPTQRGKSTEEASTKTPLHVGKEGKLSLFPHETGDMFAKQKDIA